MSTQALIQIFTENNLSFLRIGRIFSSIDLLHVNRVLCLIFQIPQSWRKTIKGSNFEKRNKTESDLNAKETKDEVFTSDAKVTLGKVYVS